MDERAPARQMIVRLAAVIVEHGPLPEASREHDRRQRESRNDQ